MEDSVVLLVSWSMNGEIISLQSAVFYAHISSLADYGRVEVALRRSRQLLLIWWVLDLLRCIECPFTLLVCKFSITKPQAVHSTVVRSSFIRERSSLERPLSFRTWTTVARERCERTHSARSPEMEWVCAQTLRWNKILKNHESNENKMQNEDYWS